MNRRVSFPLIGAALVILLGSPSAFADKKDKHKAKGGKHAGTETERGTTGRSHTAPRTTTARQRDNRDRDIRDRDLRDRDIVVLDREGHRRVITEYYSREGLPPGLAKRDSLPPGLAKQLRERGRLPPGLQKRLTPVPGGLNGRLPAAPPYYSRYFIGRDLVVLDRRTQTVVAVVPNVLP